MDTVIFACVQAAGRSQMAAAFFNALADGSRARAIAAGTEPAPIVHPEVVQVMLEHGFDLRQQRPQLLTADVVRDAGLLVTMGCGEACPAVSRATREAWFVEDAKGKRVDEVRQIRDDIRRRVLVLVQREGWARAAIVN
jgi:arsenate reductase